MSRLVLPPDVVIVPAGDLPLEARRLLPSIEGRHCVSRAGVRAPSCLIDDAGVALLTHFRRPNSIVEAIVAFSAATGRDPFGALEDAYPLFTRLSDAGLLVATDSPLASPIVPTLGPGATLGAWTVERCVHVVEDVEVYRARHGAGDLAAIKLLRHRRDAHVAAALAGEGSFLERLDGTATPRLLARGTDAGRPWLAIEWCGDATVVDAAAPLRLDPRPEARARLLAIARDAARALGGLHARGVLHGDVHERNFLVDDAGRVRVIDLGLARRIGDAGEGAASMVMASVAPELARARLAYIPPPPTLASEQYAVAALAWQVVAGCAHVEPPLGVDEALRHVAALPRSSFAERGAPPWPAVERVLRVALDPEPARRWPSLGAFARALDEVVEFERTRARRAVRATTHGGAPHRLLDALLRRVMPDRRGALDERLAPAAPGIAIALRRLAMARDDARLLDLACDWAMHAGAAHTSTTSKEAVDGVAPALACALVAHARCDDHWLGVAVRELLDGVALGGVSHPRTDSLHHLALLVECAEYEPRAWRDAVVERGRAEAACIAGSVGSDALAASRLHALLRWSEATSDAPAEATLEACRHAVGLDGRRGRLAATDARITTWHLRLCILAQQLAGDADFLEHAEHLAHALLRARGDEPTLDGGLAARGWAMLALHRATGDLAWVRRAERLAARAVRAAAGLDPALGFARGPWEAALLDAELARPEWARLPLVESEGWPRSPAPST